MTDYLVELEKKDVIYANFWLRFAALFLDGIITAPIIGIVSFINTTTWRSPIALIFIAFSGIIYKVFMEYKYGATLGKMIVKIKVVNGDLEFPSLKDILLRNVFGISIAIFSFFVSLQLIMHSPLIDERNLGQTSFLSPQSSLSFALICFIYGLDIIEGIMVAVDDRRRSIHDRIAKTFVVLK